MWQVLVVGLGGAVGSIFWFGLSEGVYVLLGRHFPYGILAANILGSLLMGILAVIIINKLELDFIWRGLVLVGFLGGFTTFSSFNIDTIQLLQEDFWLKAIIYVLSSVIICLLATGLGMWLTERLWAS